MSLKLYMHPISTASRPVSLLIAEKKLPVTEEVVDLPNGAQYKDDYLAINPTHQVPSLEDGDFRMSESSAILKYLGSKFDLPEYPKDLQKRAKVDEAMDWFNTQLMRDFAYGVVYPQIFPHHKRPSDEHHSGHIAWGHGKTKGWLEILDQKILGKNDYLANNTISIADYFAAGLMSAGEVIGCTYKDYPNICRWLGNMKKLGTWEKTNATLYGFAGSMKDKEFARV